MNKHYTFLFIGIAILYGYTPKITSSNINEVQGKTIINNQINSQSMKLGAFSISLNVKDIKVSKLFYENLGFNVLAGDIKLNYLIMKNENSLIGLFQGMIESNIITFNPGWNENGKNVERFDDIREIQQQIKDKGIILENEIESNTSGPASIIITDPDGNVIYIDQHR